MFVVIAGIVVTVFQDQVRLAVPVELVERAHDVGFTRFSGLADLHFQLLIMSPASSSSVATERSHSLLGKEMSDTVEELVSEKSVAAESMSSNWCCPGSQPRMLHYHHRRQFALRARCDFIRICRLIVATQVYKVGSLIVVLNVLFSAIQVHNATADDPVRRRDLADAAQRQGRRRLLPRVASWPSRSREDRSYAICFNYLHSICKCPKLMNTAPKTNYFRIRSWVQRGQSPKFTSCRFIKYKRQTICFMGYKLHLLKTRSECVGWTAHHSYTRKE